MSLETLGKIAGPMAIAEFRQSARSSWQALILLVPILLAAAFLPPDISTAIAAFGVFPQLAFALGVGMMKEEYEGTTLRYFWGWPVSRMRLWAMKAVSVTIFLLVIAALVVPVLYWKSGGAAPSWMDGVGGWPLLLLATAVLCVYDWAAGALAMACCRSAKLAQFVAMPLIWAGPIVGGGLFVWGPEPWAKPVALGLLLAATAPLLVGALWIHRIRNPFLERVWAWRGITAGAVTAALSVLALGGIGAVVAVGIGNFHFPGGGGEGVAHFTVSPDGRHVRVLMRDGRSEVLGPAGELTHEIENGSPLQDDILFEGLAAEPPRLLVGRTPSAWSVLRQKPDGGLIQLGEDGAFVPLWRPDPEETDDARRFFGTPEPVWLAFDPEGPRLLGTRWVEDREASVVELAWPADAEPAVDPGQPVGVVRTVYELPEETQVERVWPNGDLAVWAMKDRLPAAKNGAQPEWMDAPSSVGPSFLDAESGRWRSFTPPAGTDRSYGFGGVWDSRGGRVLYRLGREVGDDAVDWVLTSTQFPSAETRRLGEPVRTRSIRDAAAGGPEDTPQLLQMEDRLLWIGQPFYGDAPAGTPDPDADPLLFDTETGNFLGRIRSRNQAGVASSVTLSADGSRLAVIRSLEVEQATGASGFGGWRPPRTTLEVWPVPRAAEASTRLAEGQPEYTRRIGQTQVSWLPDGRLLFLEPVGGVADPEDPTVEATGAEAEPSLEDHLEMIERLNPPAWLRTADPATGEESPFGPEPSED